MKIYDISLSLSKETPEWPGNIKFNREEIRGGAITSVLSIPSHYATHIDAPKHFLFDKKSIDQIPLSSLIGKFKVIEVKSKKQISIGDFSASKIKAGDRILFKTRNSKFIGSKRDFTSDYVSLSADIAKFLAHRNIALVGIDYFGIEAKGQPGHPTHTALLEKNIVIVEGLNLKGIKEGLYNGAILPIKIKEGDGAPARALLWK